MHNDINDGEVVVEKKSIYFFLSSAPSFESLLTFCGLPVGLSSPTPLQAFRKRELCQLRAAEACASNSWFGTKLSQKAIGKKETFIQQNNLEGSYSSKESDTKAMTLFIITSHDSHDIKTLIWDSPFTPETVFIMQTLVMQIT